MSRRKCARCVCYRDRAAAACIHLTLVKRKTKRGVPGILMSNAPALATCKSQRKTLKETNFAVERQKGRLRHLGAMFSLDESENFQNHIVSLVSLFPEDIQTSALNE